MTTLNQFAWQLGAHTRITRAYSLHWHKAYVKAKPETQEAWRSDWIAHFLSGNLSDPKKRVVVTVAQAEKIMAKQRPDRTTAQQNAYRAAEMKFNYHIVRRDNTDSRVEPTKATPKKVRVSATERSAWEKFVKACGSAERAAAVAAAM